MDIKIMPELENEESAAERRNRQGQGMKILTPSQVLSRLPISLDQLEAGNNSEKIKNEIRQLLYSLYCSKNITKQVYNNLIKPIWIKNTIVAHKIFIIIIIITIIIIIVTIKGMHYKKWRQFLWIRRIVKWINHTDLN